MIDRSKKRVTMLPNEGAAKPGSPLREWANAFTAARTFQSSSGKVNA